MISLAAKSAVKGFTFSMLLIAGIFLSACQGEETVRKEDMQYFDLKGLIERQITVLNNTKPNVTKTAQLGDDRETVAGKDVDWEKELQAFIQADINKPSYAGNYDIVRQDSASFEYRIKKGVNLPVRLLRVADTGSEMRIDATILSENRIYESSKNVHLILNNTGNAWLLSSYSIDGYQKLAFLERKTFKVDSKIGL